MNGSGRPRPLEANGRMWQLQFMYNLSSKGCGLHFHHFHTHTQVKLPRMAFDYSMKACSYVHKHLDSRTYERTSLCFNEWLASYMYTGYKANEWCIGHVLVRHVTRVQIALHS